MTMDHLDSLVGKFGSFCDTYQCDIHDILTAPVTWIDTLQSRSKHSLINDLRMFIVKNKPELLNKKETTENKTATPTISTENLTYAQKMAMAKAKAKGQAAA